MSDAQFRDVIGHFASGVAVVTSEHEGRCHGSTATAVSSLSADPPMILVCLNTTSDTGKAIVEAGIFAVSILRDDQDHLAIRFATKADTKFDGVDFHPGVTGAPLLDGSLAHLECEVSEIVSGGTHHVFLGSVVGGGASEGLPLAYFRGGFGQIQPAREEAVYQTLRRMVLTREFPVGEGIDLEAVSKEHGFGAASVHAALTRLHGDGLVSRVGDDEFLVVPITAKIATEAMQARCQVEIAVLDLLRHAAEPVDFELLRRHAQAACDAAQAAPVDVDVLARANAAFHTALVGLAGNGRLAEFHSRLGIGRIWRRALPRGDEFVHPNALLALTDLCVAGEFDDAMALLRRYSTEVSAMVSSAIEANGGTV